MALALACIIWVFLATATAFLPMRYQMVPGFLLLTSAFVLIWWVGRDVSPWAALAALAAFVSMFRRPLYFLTRRALGLPVERPRGLAMESLTLACLWVLVATAIAMTRGRYHWPAAYGLIAIGIPILGYVTLQNGPVAGLLVLAGGVSMLRWPVRYLGRWVVRQVRGRAE